MKLVYSHVAKIYADMFLYVRQKLCITIRSPFHVIDKAIVVRQTQSFCICIYSNIFKMAAMKW